MHEPMPLCHVHAFHAAMPLFFDASVAYCREPTTVHLVGMADTTDTAEQAAAVDMSVARLQL
jgi:hypothetical protein